jgi:hypothetical protein
MKSTDHWYYCVAFVLVALICAGVLDLGNRAHAQSQPPDVAQRQAQRDAFNRGGLHAAAAVTGSYVGESPISTAGSPAYLSELATLSDLIVVGTSSDGVCKLTADERSIVTIHDVVVEMALKGHLAPNGHVALIVPGGKVSFSDATVAEVRTPGFIRPPVGHRLVLFLRRATRSTTAGLEAFVNLGDAWVPTAGPVGVYDLANPFRPFVIPSGGTDTPLGKRLAAQKMAPDQFIGEVRQAAWR